MVIKFIVFSFVLNTKIMGKETPLQWYVKWLWFIEDEYKYSLLTEEEYLDKKDGLFKKALELEREIIRKSYLDGRDNEYDTSKDYYEENFKSE